MKQRIVTKVLSVLLALILMATSLPLTVLAADNGMSASNSSSGAKKELTPSEAIEYEMSQRKTITKNRNHQLTPGTKAAVFKNGLLIVSGDFLSMFFYAKVNAPKVTKDMTKEDIARLDTYELVMYDDFMYGATSLTVSGIKLTIDLNGHLLGRYDKGGTVINVKDASVLTIMDSNPDRPNRGRMVANGLWEPVANGNQIIHGGVIVGGYLKTGDGGGLCIEGKSTVYMLGGTIAGNKADVGSAAYLTEQSTLDMSRGTATICYNYCAGTSSDGGAIFLRSDCTVIGGFVHHNVADDYGGGIRAKGGNILIKDVILYANRAEEYGGGIYVERSWKGQTVTITGCKIIRNYANDDGGGVYLYDLMMTNMSDCHVENNVAKGEGGGICISKTMGTDLTISGKMIVRNNYKSTKDISIKSNLYIQGDDDLIVGSMSIMSEVWIKTGKDPKSYSGVGNPFLAAETSASQYHFYSDVEDYYVYYQNDPSKSNFRYMYLSAVSRDDADIKLRDKYMPTEEPRPYEIQTAAYAGRTSPLYKGYFEYFLSSSSEYYSLSPFYYSDGYFFENAWVYNNHLATMSANLAIAAFGRYTTDVNGNAYANNFADVKQIFSDIGCSDANFYANEDYVKKPAYYGEDGRLSTIGVAISQKDITLRGDTYTLVPVAIRGGNYEAEWASNVTVGENGESKGFADAADQVYKQIQQYINDYGLAEKAAAGKVRFWVVGYSRAGATANLTSKRLVDNYASKGNVVYGYTFEAPMGGSENAKDKSKHTSGGTYPTIHNTINENDFVTLLVPSSMGFIRYGVDHLIGADHNIGWDVSNNPSSEYYKQKKIMLEQLKAINPYYNFDDSWEVADVNVVLGNIPLIGTNLIDKGEQSWDKPNPECLNIYDFLRWFFKKVLTDGFNISDISKAREYYATYKPLMSIPGNEETYSLYYSDAKYNFGYSDLTVEQAVVKLMDLMMGQLSEEQMNELINVLSGSANGIISDLTNFKTWLLGLVPLGGSIIPFIVSFAVDISTIYGLYSDLIKDWDTHSELKKAQVINDLLHKLLNRKTGGKTIWSVLDENQETALVESLPVILWFALNYASMDYNKTEDDDGMWGVGTFINNISSLTSNHFAEVTLAWVRSYDSYYNYYIEDTIAYRLDTSAVKFKDPTAKYAPAKRNLTLSGEAGSNLYYSVDNGKSWSYYSGPVDLEYRPESILYFSIYRGVKSEVKSVPLNGWAGTILGNGNVWFLIGGAACVVAISVIAVEMSRKKKKNLKK